MRSCILQIGWKIPLIAIFFMGNIGIFGCKKKDTGSENAPPPPILETPSKKVEEPIKEIPVYVYKADRLRDPFMPVGFSTAYQPDAVFDPQRALVKAIIFGNQMKSAALSMGGAGSYFVKIGKIFDIMGKPVEGFKAQVFVNKVVIQNEAGEIFELNIRETEEENN